MVFQLLIFHINLPFINRKILTVNRGNFFDFILTSFETHSEFSEYASNKGKLRAIANR